MLQRLVDITTNATAAFEKESKQLLVRLDNDFISLALADKATGTWEAAEIFRTETADHADEQLIGHLKQVSSLVNYKGLSAHVLVETAEVIAVPVALASDAMLFFRTQFGNHTEILWKDRVNETILFAFASQHWQQQLIAALFPDASVNNTLALLTRHALQQTRKEDPYLHLHVGQTYAEAVLIQQGQLSIARNITYSTPHDLLYHLLNIARQFEVQPDSLSVQVQGLIQEEDTLYQLLKEYFAPVGFASHGEPVGHIAFRPVPPHYFTGLMLSV